MAFYDLDPQAPVHILIIPKEHIQSVEEITAENSAIVGHIFEVAAKLAKENGLNEGFALSAMLGKTVGKACRTFIFICLAVVP